MYNRITTESFVKTINGLDIQKKIKELVLKLTTEKHPELCDPEEAEGKFCYIEDKMIFDLLWKHAADENTIALVYGHYCINAAKTPDPLFERIEKHLEEYRRERKEKEKQRQKRAEEYEAEHDRLKPILEKENVFTGSIEELDVPYSLQYDLLYNKFRNIRDGVDLYMFASKYSVLGGVKNVGIVAYQKIIDALEAKGYRSDYLKDYQYYMQLPRTVENALRLAKMKEAENNMRLAKKYYTQAAERGSEEAKRWLSEHSLS